MDMPAIRSASIPSGVMTEPGMSMLGVGLLPRIAVTSPGTMAPGSIGTRSGRFALRGSGDGKKAPVGACPLLRSPPIGPDRSASGTVVNAPWIGDTGSAALNGLSVPIREDGLSAMY